MDHDWDTDNMSSSDLSRPIIAIHLVAYPSSSMEDGDEPLQQTNHWCFFLEFGDDTSVKLEVTPGNGSNGLRAKIRLVSKTHACTSNDIQKLTFNLDSSVCLADLVGIAQAHDRQRYQFAPGWEGCRYWNYVFIQDLENHTILARGASNQAWGIMSWFYHSVRGVERRSIKMGMFRPRRYNLYEI